MDEILAMDIAWKGAMCQIWSEFRGSSKNNGGQLLSVQFE